jgi:hypothetical protein
MRSDEVGERTQNCAGNPRTEVPDRQGLPEESQASRRRPGQPPSAGVGLGVWEGRQMVAVFTW